MAMIDAVDLFVFLDDVKFERSSWQCRNRIKGPNGIMWLSVPVHHMSEQLVKDVQINYATDWRKKHLASIQQAYAGVRYSQDVSPWYNLYISSLCDLNEALIFSLAQKLGCRIPRFLNSSTLNVGGHKAEHLGNILRAVGCTEYLANPGSREYLEPCLPFDGIKVTWFDYKHPTYPQIRGDFVPYMSAVDILMNCGATAINYIREGWNG
jgi:hypothetical protein